MSDLVNYLGNPVSHIPEFRKPEYWKGTYDDAGRPEPDWSLCINADKQGFDLGDGKSGTPHRVKVELPKHTRLIRYGLDSGFFTAPKGTKYEELSLPYTKESVPYHEYEVVADSITVHTVYGDNGRRKKILEKCMVEKGKVAPGFDYPGGGIQYFHEYTMRESIRLHLLREI